MLQGTPSHLTEVKISMQYAKSEMLLWFIFSILFKVMHILVQTPVALMPDISAILNAPFTDHRLDTNAVPAAEK